MLNKIKEGMFIRFGLEWGDSIKKPWFRVLKIEGQKIILHDNSVIVQDHQKLETWEPKIGDKILIKTPDGHLISNYEEHMKDYLIEPYNGPEPIIKDKILNKSLLFNIYLSIEEEHIDGFLGYAYREIKMKLENAEQPDIKTVEKFLEDIKDSYIERLIKEDFNLSWSELKSKLIR